MSLGALGLAIRVMPGRTRLARKRVSLRYSIRIFRRSRACRPRQQTANGADPSTVCQPGDGRLPSGFGIPVGTHRDNRPEHKLENTEFGARYEFSPRRCSHGIVTLVRVDRFAGVSV